MQAELKGKIDNSTIIVGDFNTPLSIMVRITKQKISNDKENLYNTINQADMTNMGTTFHPITKYMHSSQVSWGIFQCRPYFMSQIKSQYIKKYGYHLKYLL